MASKTPNFDSKVKDILNAIKFGERVCPISGEKWELTQEEIDCSKKFMIPQTNVSPTVRRIWIRGFIISATIWWNKDAITGEPLLSYVHPDNKVSVMDDLRWHAEEIGSQYPQDVNISELFFKQLRNLAHRVPVTAQRRFGEAINTVGVGIINAEDSFMVFGGINNAKRCAYAFGIDDSEDVQEAYHSNYSRQSFGLVYCSRMHKCRGAIQCTDCMNCDFVFDCRNCEHCFMSSNLRNKKYVFKNKYLSEQEYKEKMRIHDLSSWEVYQQHLGEYIDMLGSRAVWPENFNVQCDDCTGEYLMRCTRCHDCFWAIESNDCYQSQFLRMKSEGCAYVCGAFSSMDCYASAASFQNSNLKFCGTMTRCQNMEYCLECFDCEDCFGCIGLKKKRFCVFNKEYSENEYWQKVDELKCAMLERGEYGSFLPGDFSTAGMEFVLELHGGVNKDYIEKMGGEFFDPSRGTVISERQEQQKQKALSPSELPDRLEDGEEYIGKPFLDKDLNRPFAIRGADYKFYKDMQLPMPRTHYMERLPKWTHMANTYTYKKSSCFECSKEISIADNLTFPNKKVFCSDCYLKYLEKYG